MLPRPNPAVLFQPLPEGAVLLDSAQETYFGLNQVGAQVWELLPPACTTMDQVCASLSEKYPGVDMNDLQADVTELLDLLAQQGLVVQAEAG